MVPRWLTWTSMGAALVSLALSLYLSLERAHAGIGLVCPAGDFSACQVVTRSSYSVVAGVPVAWNGVLWSLLILALSTPPAWQRPQLRAVRWLVIALGLASVIYLVAAEVALGAFCSLCTIVHVAVVLIAALAAAAWVLGLDRPAERDQP